MVCTFIDRYSKLLSYSRVVNVTKRLKSFWIARICLKMKYHRISELKLFFMNRRKALTRLHTIEWIGFGAVGRNKAPRDEYC